MCVFNHNKSARVGVRFAIFSPRTNATTIGVHQIIFFVVGPFDFRPYKKINRGTKMKDRR